MTQSLDKSTVLSPADPSALAFPFENLGGKKQGVMGRPVSGIAAEDSRIEIELPSVEPDSETGIY